MEVSEPPVKYRDAGMRDMRMVERWECLDGWLVGILTLVGGFGDMLNGVSIERVIRLFLK